MHLPNCSKMNEENTELVPLFGLHFERLYLNGIFAMITAQLQTELMIREPNHNSKLFLAGKQP